MKSVKGPPQQKSKDIQIYLTTLSEIEKAVIEDNVDALKKLSQTIENIHATKSKGLLRDLRDFRRHAENPLGTTNLIILACKHGRINILEYLLSNQTKILSNLSVGVGQACVSPSAEDSSGHNAFYYAIRSRNVDMVTLLIKKWPGNYFSDHSEQLEGIISSTYEELRLKNVALSNDMQVFLESRLIDLRFFSKTSKNKQISLDVDNIKQRINFIVNSVRLLQTECPTIEKFLFVLKFLAQNMHVLKRQMKSTYARLPWEEMEFCCVCFIASHTKQQGIKLVYNATIDKNKLVNYLEMFAAKLELEKDAIDSVDLKKLADLPKLSRDEVVETILNNFPEFGDLYRDYQQIRDITSLKKINDCITLAVDSDPKHKGGQLLVMRVLQVMGEHLKNTLESPKLSGKTSRLFLLSLPSNTRKVVTSLRNSLSHSYSLSKRIEIEMGANVKFFSGILEDVKKVGEAISEILLTNNVKMVENLLRKLVDSKNAEEMKQIATVLANVDYPARGSQEYYKMGPDRLRKLVDELDMAVTDKTAYELKLFEDVKEILSKAKEAASDVIFDYAFSFGMLKSLLIRFSENEPDDTMTRLLKCSANTMLQNIIPEVRPDNLRKVGELIRKIEFSIRSRALQSTPDKFYRPILNIYYVINFKTGDIRWMESLKEKLSKKGVSSVKAKQKAAHDLAENKIDKHLLQKMSKLRDILNNNPLSGDKTCARLKTVVEMLLLDIMSILGNSLEHNVHFLDEDAPLLIGKNLRNHLAHHNDLVEVLTSNLWLSISLNAKKLTEKTSVNDKVKIGKFTPDDPSKLGEKFRRNLSVIDGKLKMFQCLENGDLEGLKRCVAAGADLTARSLDSWSALHFAAKGPSLEMVKYVLEQNLKLCAEDDNGQTALHIAARYGRKETVEFLIKDKNYFVEAEDRLEQTPLHLAAINGHKDTVRALLKHNSNTNTLDVKGLAPLHCAIRNNHFKIVKLLLEKEADVDLNQTSGGFTPLYEAAEFGSLDIVNLLLKEGANVNAQTDTNNTPIYSAAINGHFEIVRALIAKNADVNAASFDGMTALRNAAETGRLEIAQLLLEHGANVNCSDKTCRVTPLHFAAKDGHVKIAETLLEYKVDPNAVTVDGATPLHFAVRDKRLEIVTMLLERGVKINAKDKNCATPLHYATENGQAAIADILVKFGANIDEISKEDITPLHVAALQESKDVVGVLLRNGADVNLRDVRDRTALHFAAINGDINIMAILLKYGAKIDGTARESITPLQAAAANGHEAAVAFLIEKGADVNTAAKYGKMSLHMAVMGGNENIINLLIKHGVHVNARAAEDVTPLHFAVEAGFGGIVEILITNGAEVNAKDEEGETPLSVAIKRNRKEIVEILVKRGVDVNDIDTVPLSMAVCAGYRDIVDILLRNGADPNVGKTRDALPLTIAAIRGFTDIARALIKKGAEVNAAISNGRTPLHLAWIQGHSETVEILLSHGADVNAKDRDGLTALHYEATSGDDEVVELLLAYGADFSVRDGKNRTSLELAVAHGRLGAVKRLLERDRDVINVKGNDGWTMLHIASQGSNLEIVKYLVEQGGDLHARNEMGSKPLHIAAREGFQAAVDFYFEKGMDLNDPGAAGQTLLHYAAMKGHLEVTKNLISKGADVNVRDRNGQTPLHEGASCGFKDIVEVLLKNGAIYEAPDYFCRTPLHLAKEKARDVLQSTERLFEAVKRNNCEDVERHIKAGACLDAKNKELSTPLHYAAWKGFNTIPQLLLEHGADPNTVGKQGLTALHYAAKYSHLKIVADLLSFGTVYDPLSHGGKTPLDLCEDERITRLLTLVNESFRNVRNGCTRVVKVLDSLKDVETLKAVMNACDRDKRTLVVAAIHCDFPKVERLQEVGQGDVSIQVKIANNLMASGNYEMCLTILRAAYDRRKAILGPDNPGTLDLQGWIARGVYKQGLYLESLKMHEEILEKQTKALGSNNKHTLNTRSRMALIMHRLGRDEEAYGIFREVYRKQKEILGDDDDDTIETLFHMALTLDRLGRYEEALSANREIYKKHRAALGDSNQATISALNNIAMVLTNKGEHDEALEIYREVYAKKKAVLGKEHVDTLRTLHSIVMVLRDQHKMNEALKTIREVLEKQKRTLGRNHPETQLSQCTLGDLLIIRGCTIGALKAYKECSHHPQGLEIQEKIKAIAMTFRCQDMSLEEVLAHLQTEMNTAADGGHIKTVLRLLRNGADCNDGNVEGRTPLHFAASRGHLGLVRVLLVSGADPGRVTNKGNTPLHSAVSKNHGEVVEELLRHGSGDVVNAKTVSGGNTALHVAAKGGFLAVAKCLLRFGASYEVSNAEGKRPLDLTEDEAIGGLLRSIEDLFRYARSGNAKIVALLGAMAPDEMSAAVNACDKDGNTLLRVVMLNRHENVMRGIVEVMKRAE